MSVESKYTNELVGIGLSEKEATIYFYLLHNTTASITEISKGAQIKRPTCYIYIEEMLRKGMLNRVPVGKKFKFSAIPPEKLVNVFKRNVNKFEESLPELSDIYNQNLRETKVTFFKGKQGVREIYNDSFSTVGDAYSIFPADEYFKKYSMEEFKNNEKVISQTKFKSKDLIIDGKSFKEVDEFLKGLGNDSKIYKKLDKSFNTSVDVLIYGSKVALISLKSLDAVVIDNPEIAELFKLFHKKLWQ